MEGIEQSNAEPTPVEETNTTRSTATFEKIDLQLLGGPAEAARGNGNQKVGLSVRPEAAQTQNQFSMIRQGPVTNTFTKLKATSNKNTNVDPITGTATITKSARSGCLTVSIENFDGLEGLRTSTHLLLDALTIEFTRAGAGSPKVALPLTKYMELRGLKDRREARKQVEEDLATLFAVTLSYKWEKNPKGEEDFSDMRIIGKKGIRHGIITVTFEPDYCDLLTRCNVMPYLLSLFGLKHSKYPNSYFLGRKIGELKNMNAVRENGGDIISVKALLNATPFLPSYEEVMKTDKHLSQRIIEPFERDMDALSDALTWTYCHSNNAPLTDEETEIMSYDIFKDLLVKIDWKQYPDQTARIERRAKRIAQAEQAKGTRPKGKNPSKKKTTK